MDSRQIYGKRSKAEGVGRKVGKSQQKRFLWHKITEEVETASKILRGAVSLEMKGRIHPSKAGKKEARTYMMIGKIKFEQNEAWSEA